MNIYVYVLTRTMDGDVVVDGVFTTKEKAEKYQKELLESFGIEESEEDDSEYDFEIHTEQLL